MNRRGIIRLAVGASAAGALSLIAPKTSARAQAAPGAGRPFQAVLPGVAAGEGGAATLQQHVAPSRGSQDTPSTAGLTIQGLTLLGSGRDTFGTSVGGSWIAGEVLNGLDHAVANVQVQVVIGEFTRLTTARLTIVPPGGTTPFVMTVPGVLQPGDSPTASVASYDDPAPGPATDVLVGHAEGPHEVDAGPPDPKTGVQPESQEIYGINGTISNTSTRSWALQDAILTAYDDKGNVVLVSSAEDFLIPFAALDDNVLPAGKTAKFLGTFPRPDYNAVRGDITIRVTVNAQPQ